MDQIYNKPKINTHYQLCVDDIEMCACKDLDEAKENYNIARRDIAGLERNTNNNRNAESNILRNIQELTNKQAEKAAMDRNDEEKMQMLTAEHSNVLKELTQLDRQIAKLEDQTYKSLNSSENVRFFLRNKARIYCNLTGIHWDYDQVTEDYFQGYAQSKSALRIKTFRQHKEAPRCFMASCKLWQVVAEVTRK